MSYTGIQASGVSGFLVPVARARSLDVPHYVLLAFLSAHVRGRNLHQLRVS